MAMDKRDELVEKCEEIRRIWQGPGQHSHALRVAMHQMFALLPEPDDVLRVHVTDSLAMRSKFGG